MSLFISLTVERDECICHASACHLYDTLFTKYDRLKRWNGKLSNQEAALSICDKSIFVFCCFYFGNFQIKLESIISCLKIPNKITSVEKSAGPDIAGKFLN